MKKRQLCILLTAFVLAAGAAGCGSDDSSSGGSSGKETSSEKSSSSKKEKKAKEETEETSEASQGELLETDETYTYTVGSVDLEMNVDLDKYLNTETNIFNMTQLATDLGYNEMIKDQENSFGVRLGNNSSWFTGTTVDVLLTGRQAATDVDGEELTPYSELTVSWKGEEEGSVKVTQDDVSQARYTIGKSTESVSYEMAILTAYAMTKSRAQTGDPFDGLLGGSGGTYTIAGTVEEPYDENEEFVEGTVEEAPVETEETTVGAEEDPHGHEHEEEGSEEAAADENAG